MSRKSWDRCAKYVINIFQMKNMKNQIIYLELKTWTKLFLERALHFHKRAPLFDKGAPG